MNADAGLDALTSAHGQLLASQVTITMPASVFVISVAAAAVSVTTIIAVVAGRGRKSRRSRRERQGEISRLGTDAPTNTQDPIAPADQTRTTRQPSDGRADHLGADVSMAAGAPHTSVSKAVHVGPPFDRPDVIERAKELERPKAYIQLVRLRSADRSIDLPLGSDGIRIGRAHDNDLVVADTSVGMHHASLTGDRGRWFLLPEITDNGTFVNGNEVAPGHVAELRPGESLALGPNVVLELSVEQVATQTPSVRLMSSGKSAPGHRQQNQDAHLATVSVVAVADGVGGRNAGDVASRMAIETVAANDASTSRAELDAVRAHRRIVERATDEPLLYGMATTLDVVRLVRAGEQDLLDGAHVGDGVVYLCEGGQIRTLTRPHTVGQQLAEIDPEHAKHVTGDPDYSGIVQALGFDVPLRPQLWQVPARAGQRLVLASDGLAAALGEQRARELIQATMAFPPEEAATQLTRDAADGPDNVTVVIADIVGVPAATAGMERARTGGKIE